MWFIPLCLLFLRFSHPALGLEPWWTGQTVEYLSKGFFDSFWGSVLSDLDNVSQNISRPCKRSLQVTTTFINSGKPWAFRFLDASGKAPHAVLEGNIASLGDYSQCVETTAKNDGGETLFGGQYCMLKMRSLLECEDKHLIGDFSSDLMEDTNVIMNRLTRFPVSHGVCVPSLCTVNDVETIVRASTKSTFWNLTKVAYCVNQESRSYAFSKLSGAQKISLIVLLTMLLLVAQATAFECLCMCASWKLPKFFAMFSAINNFKQLIARRPDDDKRFLAADRIRSFIVTADLFMHANGFSGLYKVGYMFNKVDVLAKQLADPVSQIVGSQAGHEALIFTGSITASIAVLKCFQRNKPAKTCLLRLFKWWFRVTPIMLIAFAVQIVFPLVGEGPSFNDAMSEQSEICSKVWWKAALMIHNLYSMDELCIPSTWSVPTEFQLQIFLTLVALTILLSKTLGLCATVMLIVLGMFFPGYFVYKNNVQPFMVLPIDVRALEDTMWYLRLNPLIHLSSYFITFLCIYVRYQGFHLKLSKRAVAFGYIAVGVFCLIVCSWNALWNVWQFERNDTLFILYEALSRPSFTLCAAWMLLTSEDLGAVLHSPNQPTKDYKGMKIEKGQHKHSLLLLVTSRLAASTYLAHSFFIYYDQLTSPVLLRTDAYGINKQVLVTIFGSYVTGLIFYLCVEAPLTNVLTLHNQKTVSKEHKE